VTYDLYIGRKRTDVSIEPDATWPGMWRIRQGERVSDMVNMARAKDAAITWWRPKGLGAGEVAYWHRRESPRKADESEKGGGPWWTLPLP
jgi:hypothetical protein